MDLEGMQELQEVDIRRDHALREHRQIDEQITPPPFIAQLDAEIAAQETLQTQVGDTLREARALSQTAQRRIEATDQRIYSGAVTDHRTLSQLQADLYSQRQQLPALEDAVLNAEINSQDGAEAVAWLRQLRQRALDHWEGRQRDLVKQRADIQAQLDELQAEVDGHRARLTGEDLQTYDLYRRRRPRVVASVVGGVCSECRLSLPTMVITRARRGNRPIECPACHCLVRVA